VVIVRGRPGRQSANSSARRFAVRRTQSSAPTGLPRRTQIRIPSSCSSRATKGKAETTSPVIDIDTRATGLAPERPGPLCTATPDLPTRASNTTATLTYCQPVALPREVRREKEGREPLPLCATGFAVCHALRPCSSQVAMSCKPRPAFPVSNRKPARMFRDFVFSSFRDM
jgi:hypothetical protein